MHANEAIWVLMTILSYCYAQEPLSITATTEATNNTNILPTDNANNTLANSAANPSTIVANNTSDVNVTDVNLANDLMNNMADSEVNNTVGNSANNTRDVNNLTNTNNLANGTASSTVDTTTIGPTESRNCTTARYIKGECVRRRLCDYNSPNIDLTLYAPSWYKKPCQSDEVCCPFNSILPEPPQINEDEFNDFDD